MIPKVSVIIPIYNSSKYISRCCRSLFNQTLDSLEYIFVDDGSEDGSRDVIKEILSDYPHRSSQVVYIRLKENLGVGAARNIGLRQAKGEYVIHCDSDDWVEQGAYEFLYQKAIESKAEIVTCGYYIDWEGKERSDIVSAPQFDRSSLIFDIGPQTGALWIKLIRRKLLVDNNLQVPNDIDWGEDLCLSLESLLLSENIQYVQEHLYHYVQHDDSLTHYLSIGKCLSLIKCGHVIEFFLKEHNLDNQYAFQLNWLKFQLKQYFLIFPQTRNIALWKSLYPECHRSLLAYKCPTYLKISAWLIVHHLEVIAIFILNIKDIVSPLKYR